jgi:pyruvate dehydrogenase E2 component (dihydrolipoamide acetyltransferase)
LGVDVKQLSQRFGNRLITEEDIRNAAGAGTQVAPPAAAGVPLTRMREAIAQRTQRSKQEVPHFYLMGDVDMTAALHARRSGVAKCSLTILVARACALALREMPEANITFENRQLHVRNTIDLGVAVSVPGGLFVPVIRRADSRELAEMDAWLSETKGRLEKGKFRPTDFGERSLTISNLGMHQVDRFIAIIDQPDAAMLAVGAVEERAVVRDGAVVVRPMCTLTLSVDHRALDGVDGAKLLNLIRKNLAAAA